MGNGRGPGMGGLPYSASQRVWGGGLGGFTMGAAGGGMVAVLLRILGESSGAETAIGRTQAGLQSLMNTARNMSAAISAASLGAVAGIVALGEQGTRVLLVRDAWRELMTGMDIDGQKILGTLDQIAKGQMSTTELMLGMNRAALLGGKTMAEELPALMAIASDSARRMGLTLADAFQYIVLGVGRASWMILDNLGIVVDITGANERYAESIGKVATELTKEERITALLTAIKAKYGSAIEAIIEREMYAAERVQAMRASLRNLYDEIKIAAVPIIIALLKVIQPLLDTLERIPREALTAVLGITALAAGFGVLAGVLTPVLTVIGLITSGVVSLGTVLGFLIPFIALFAIILPGMVATAGALVAIWRAWSLNLSDIQGKVADLGRVLVFFGRDVYAVFRDAFGRIVPMIDALITGDWEVFWNNLKAIVINVATLILEFWRLVARRFYEYGRSLIVEFRNGIVSAYNAYIVPVLVQIGNLIRRFLGSRSPPEAGPLSEIVQWGRNLIGEYLRGFLLADFSPLREIGNMIRRLLDVAAAIRGTEMAPIQAMKLYRELRIELARLIRDWRETGEVNEEVMASMVARLGEGGEEVEKLIRLWFDYQRAIENLRDIEKQVAEAREAGYVPGELLEQLKTAEEQVSTAEEAYKWQMEYLEALAETADVQREILVAVEALTEAIEELAEEIEEAGEGMEAFVPEEPPVIPFAPTEVKMPEIDLSAYFLQLRGEIRMGLEGIKQTISEELDKWVLTIQEKLAPIRTWLETNIVPPWSRIFREVLPQALRGFVQNLDPKIIDAWRFAWDRMVEAMHRAAPIILVIVGLLNTLLVGIVERLLEALPGLGTLFSGILIGMAANAAIIVDLFSGILELTYTLLTDWRSLPDKAREVWGRLVEDFGWLKEGFTLILLGLRDIGDALFGDLLVSIGEAFMRIVDKARELKDGFLIWWAGLWIEAVQNATDFRLAVEAKVVELVTGVLNWLLWLKDEALARYEEIRIGVTTKIEEMKTKVLLWVGDLVLGFLNKVIELKDKVVGPDGWIPRLVTGFIDTMKGIWIGLFGEEGVFPRLFGKFKNFFTDPEEGLIAKMKDWGKDLIQGLIDGIRAMWDRLVGIINELRNLWPFSRAKEGPLRKSINWKGYLTGGLDEALATVRGAMYRSLEIGGPIVMAQGVAGGARTLNIYLVNPTFPDIQDGRDREDFMSSIQEQIELATALAGVPGGSVA